MYQTDTHFKKWPLETKPSFSSLSTHWCSSRWRTWCEFYIGSSYVFWVGCLSWSLVLLVTSSFKRDYHSPDLLPYKECDFIFRNSYRLGFLKSYRPFVTNFFQGVKKDLLLQMNQKDIIHYLHPHSYDLLPVYWSVQRIRFSSVYTLSTSLVRRLWVSRSRSLIYTVDDPEIKRGDPLQFTKSTSLNVWHCHW